MKKPKIITMPDSDSLEEFIISDHDWNRKNFVPLKESEVIITDYHDENYEGHGEMLFKYEGKWYRKGLGHCSCYGPLDDVGYALETPFKSLGELKKRITDDLYNSVEPMIAELRRRKIR